MYKTLKYNSKERWLSYWYQINELLSKSPESILVIGKGSGIIENAISTIAADINITTLDMAPAVSPDVVGDMQHMPFRESCFDSILCCQVLEHLPFSKVKAVLQKLQRISRGSVIVSVPHRRKHLKLAIDAPLIGKRTIILKYPFMRKLKRANTDSKNHFWEINRVVSYGSVKKALDEFFIIEKTFLNEMNCTHRFFILRSKRSRL